MVRSIVMKSVVNGSEWKTCTFYGIRVHHCRMYYEHINHNVKTTKNEELTQLCSFVRLYDAE